MIAVLDASGAAEILLNRKKQALFANYLREASCVIAPDLFIPEIANVFWKLHHAGILEHDLCFRLAEDGIGLIDETVDSGELWKESLIEAIRTKHPVYDMLYAVLARRTGAILLTNDSRLAAACREMQIPVCYGRD